MGDDVAVHITIMLLRLFVQLSISFPVLLYYSLVGMHLNLGVSFAIFLNYISNRREI